MPKSLPAIESEFISTFVEKTKRNRGVTHLSNSKRRQKFLQVLYHTPNFVEGYLEKIDRHQQSHDKIYSLLVSFGAPTECHLISAHDEIDGRTFSLKEALNEVIGFCDGTVIICNPRKLAFWEGEDLRARYLLKKT